MRVRRVRVAELREGALRLRNDESHHLARVLRVRPGDPVEAFDGRGRAADGEVARVDDGGVELRLATPTTSPREAAKQSGRARVPAVDEPVPLPRLAWRGPARVADPAAEVRLACAGEALAAAALARFEE